MSSPVSSSSESMVKFFQLFHKSSFRVIRGAWSVLVLVAQTSYDSATDMLFPTNAVGFRCLPAPFVLRKTRMQRHRA